MCILYSNNAFNLHIYYYILHKLIISLLEVVSSNWCITNITFTLVKLLSNDSLFVALNIHCVFV